MDRVQTDIIARLQTAIMDWKDEVTAAQQQLANHIADATGQLDTLSAILSEKTGAKALKDVKDRLAVLEEKRAARERTIEALKQMLAVRTDAGEAAGQHLAQTLLERAEIEQESLKLTAEIETLRAANQRLESRILAIEAQEDARRRQHRIALEALGLDGRPRKMGEILVASETISPEQLEEALSDQQDMPGRLLGTILMKKGYADEHDIAQVLASQLHIPFVRLSRDTVSPEAAGLLDGAFCTWHLCVPLRATSDLLVLAMANPLDSGAIEKIEAANARRVVPVVAVPSEITAVIESVFGAY